MVMVAVDGHQDSGGDRRGKRGREQHAEADGPPGWGSADPGTGGFRSAMCRMAER